MAAVRVFVPWLSDRFFVWCMEHITDLDAIEQTGSYETNLRRYIEQHVPDDITEVSTTEQTIAANHIHFAWDMMRSLDIETLMMEAFEMDTTFGRVAGWLLKERSGG